MHVAFLEGEWAYMPTPQSFADPAVIVNTDPHHSRDKHVEERL